MTPEKGSATSPRVDAGPVQAGGEETVAALLAAADGIAPRRLGELIERLEATGQLVTIRVAEPAPGPDPEPEPGSERRFDLAPGVRDIPIHGIAVDSRIVPAASVFVAVKGDHADGHDHLPAVAALGAAAAVVERLIPGVALPQIVVDDTRRALATAAAWWYGNPSRELGVVGITGTDGKTTTSFLVTGVLEAGGIATGMVTTAAIKVGRVRSANAEHVTTPEAPQLQRLLRAMVAAGNRAVVVETTSHGLALDRVAEIAYDVALFTNLTHEHLELHGTFEAYREAKLGLFRRLGTDAAAAKRLPRSWPRTAVVNLDDAAAPVFIEAALAAGASIVTYGESPAADVRARAIDEGPASIHIDVATPRWHGPVELRLAGRFNAHNALAAIAVGEALGLEPDLIRAGVAGVAGVPGRMERVDCGQPFGVIVDYAHSPASLEKVLDVLAPSAGRGGGLIVVFGSAGERDVQKRPMMGRIAAERCRLVVVTDEDPRGESSEQILSEIAAGAETAGKRRGLDLLCIADRRAAIEAALERAQTGDVVLLAGKGHEQTIINSDGAMPWDERAEAVRILGHLGYRS